jgi:cytochrome c oxidase cbb3-type subunit III
VTISSAPSPGVAVEAPSTVGAEPIRPTADVLEHEYDGIREYDNPLPGWWVKLFWGSFFFSIGYGFHYHLSGNGVSVSDDYEQEMSAARAEQAQRALGESVNEEGLAKVMLDAKLMADAQAIFAQRCMPCHGDRGQGVIGPNLTDGHFIHGQGTLMDIHRVVSEGVPAKGMPPWKLQLSSIQVSELAAYVGGMRGKNVAGKAPEGNPMPTAKP